MEYYRNISGRSGIISYQYTTDGIIIKFSNGGIYEYTNSSAGNTHIDNMKKLAKQGMELNTYINKNVKFSYSQRIK